MKIRNLIKEYILKYFAENLKNTKNISESEHLDALCFFSDFIEYCGQSEESQMPLELTPKYVEQLNSENDGIKQTAVYGLGVFAMFNSEIRDKV